MSGVSIPFYLAEITPPSVAIRLATLGVPWTKPGDINLAHFFPDAPPMYLARSPNCNSTRVYLDHGLVLDLVSNSTEKVETFGLWLDLPPGQHDNQINVQLEFDVIEVLQQVDEYRVIRIPYWSPSTSFGWKEVQVRLPWQQIRTNPFLGAVGVVASDGAMSSGVEDYNNDRSSGSFQVKYETGAVVTETYFRLNAPFSSGRGSFDWLRFGFFRSKFWKPIPAVTPILPWSDNSTFPLELRMTITASNAPKKPAQVTVSLTQTDAAGVTTSCVSNLGTNTFDDQGIHNDGSDTFTNSLSALNYAGFVVAVGKPATTDPSPNCGPIRARIRQLTVNYS